MSEASEAFPEHLKYTAEHEWLAEGDPATVGITKTAADALGDIVFVDLPEVGTTVEAGREIGEIESTKSVSDLYSPVTGEVVEVNQAAVDDPSTVNDDPYGAGWLFKVAVTSVGQTLTAAEYAEVAAES